MPSTQNFQQSASNVAEDATKNADTAIKATQRVANNALDQLSSKVQDVGDQAAPIINRLSAQAEALTRKTVEAVRDGSKRVRQQATNAADSTVNYIREEPVKSVLIAAAAGAALVAVARLLSSRKDRE
ncbi:MAG: hypothetical protein EOP38_09345 [Rubrivivax sp.]|nr:MAG: hypothetical protein EOP38_09345 [Rubrivivax sp.]